MGALVIVNYDITDSEALKAYRDEASPILIERGGAGRVANTDVTISLGEGDAVIGQRTVVLRFDSVEEAKRVWLSDEYQAVAAARWAATTPHFAFIVETSD